MEKEYDLEAENRRRVAALARQEEDYDPVSGRGCCGPRVAYGPTCWTEGVEMVPAELTRDRDLAYVYTNDDWVRLRSRHDFEYWAVKCVVIKDKASPRDIPLRLNAPQRRVAAMLEEDRRAGRPMRLIMLKARQWGGSTLVQVYMAWLQCAVHRNWHSLICAQNTRTAASIRGMYSKLLAHYPPQYWDGEAEKMEEAVTKPALVRYEGLEGVKTLAGRQCNITIGSAESQDAVRGSDYAMAHLSEVAFWKSTPKMDPLDFMRSVQGSVQRAPDTLIVMESTANGVGNYFHTEWLRACSPGGSDKRPVFVPWMEIPHCREALTGTAQELWASLDGYERTLWERYPELVTLEGLNWYHNKRREYASHQAVMAEFPSTAEEAFANTGCNVFAAEGVEALRRGVSQAARRGDMASATGAPTGPRALEGPVFRDQSNGEMELWEAPEPGGRYVVAVDVGGRTAQADWSVIAVFKAGERPEVVAQWRGHTDHDLLAWKAAQTAAWYNRALLVFESNTLESDEGGSEGQGAYMLHALYEHYPELYYRSSPDGGRPKPGFHTNRQTKQMIITGLIAAVRDGGYRERSAEACSELSSYQRLPNGSYAARRGAHDDILMTRAIGLWALQEGCVGPTMASDPDLARYLGRWSRR